MAVEPVYAPVTEPAPVPAGSGTLEAALQEAYLRRIAKKRPAVEVPAAAPVTEPAPAPVPRTPDGTWSHGGRVPGWWSQKGLVPHGQVFWRRPW